YAVGEKKGVVEMNPAVKGNEGGTSVGHGGDKADRLSIDSLGLKNVSFIKIDVEGYENHVLDGAVKTIKANKPVILCEIMGGNPLETALPVVKEKILHTIAKFKALGYKVTRVSACDYLAVPMG
ncbi:MAG TPA: FkbM family methyltransferase, partial [Gammaproteobacteria bacterium]|nr:FkbM family methyltransferase [Gammaproteobacteria bacterium]